MLKRRSLLLRPADSPRLPADSRRLCHPASPTPVAQRRRGSGYRVSESLPELIPFNQQVHQVLSDAPPWTPGPLSLLRHVPERSSPSRVPSRKSFQKRKRFSSAAHTPRALDGSGPFRKRTEIRESGQLQTGQQRASRWSAPSDHQKGTFLLSRNEGHF